MTVSSAEQVDLDVLAGIQQRVLWLATRIVDAANHDRDRFHPDRLSRCG